MAKFSYFVVPQILLAWSSLVFAFHSIARPGLGKCSGSHSLCSMSEANSPFDTEPKIAVRFINLPFNATGEARNSKDSTPSEMTCVVPSGSNLMKIADDAGIYIPRGCKTGLCGSCTADILMHKSLLGDQADIDGLDDDSSSPTTLTGEFEDYRHQIVRACTTTVMDVGCKGGPGPSDWGEMVVDLYRLTGKTKGSKRKASDASEVGTATVAAEAVNSDPLSRFSGDWENNFRPDFKRGGWTEYTGKDNDGGGYGTTSNAYVRATRPDGSPIDQIYASVDNYGVIAPPSSYQPPPSSSSSSSSAVRPSPVSFEPDDSNNAADVDYVEQGSTWTYSKPKSTIESRFGGHRGRSWKDKGSFWSGGRATRTGGNTSPAASASSSASAGSSAKPTPKGGRRAGVGNPSEQLSYAEYNAAYGGSIGVAVEIGHDQPGTSKADRSGTGSTGSTGFGFSRRRRSMGQVTRGAVAGQGIGARMAPAGPDPAAPSPTGRGRRGAGTGSGRDLFTDRPPANLRSASPDVVEKESLWGGSQRVRKARDGAQASSRAYQGPLDTTIAEDGN